MSVLDEPSSSLSSGQSPKLHLGYSWAFGVSDIAASTTSGAGRVWRMPSRRQLRERAAEDLGKLLAIPGSGPATGLAGLRMLSFVDQVLTDGAPTPQVSSDGEGGVDVRFLAADWAVEASFLDDGSYSIWLTDPSGRQVDAFDGEPGATPPQRLLERVRRRLEVMGTAVRHRA